MRIAVVDDYQDAFRQLGCYARLKNHDVEVFRDTEKDTAKLAARLKDADAVILTQQRSSFPRALIDQLPQLRLVVQIFNNTDHIDVAACTEKGIAVAYFGRADGSAPAELTWGLIIESLRHVGHEFQQMKQGVWQTTLGHGLQGKTLGIYALGNIGSRVAKVGNAFGMKVLCWGREASRAKALAAGYDFAASREAFFAGADVLSLHIRLNPQTHGIITAADLACMQTSALIVNTSRAALIAPQALVEALHRGRPGYAAVDVYDEEPVLGGQHPLLAMPNALCTPHIGGTVVGYYERFYGEAIDSILAFAAGTPVNVINPEALAGSKS